jgi:hypothetical protein
MLKKCIICKHTEKIDVTSGMATLQGHLALKLVVVPPLHGALGSHLTKITRSGPPHTCKMENSVFLVVAHITIIAKVVGNRDMHNTAKYGGQDSKVFLFKSQKSKTLASFPRNPINLVRGSSFL